MKNARGMKAANRLAVLCLLRRQRLSRSELAAVRGLTRAAMSLIIGGLISEGLVEETGHRNSAAGRRPVLVELRPGYAHSLGLTISRTGAEAGVTDLAGNLLCRVPVDIAGLTRAAALRRMKDTLKVLIRKYSPPGNRWLGLGISTPGPVNVTTGTILNPPNFETWHNLGIADEMRTIGLSNVFLENNSQALTMAEKAYGVGRDTSSFLLLVVETGIGAGIVLKDQLYSGWRGFGNEIGHTSVDLNGPPCDCGQQGCVEIFASVQNIVAAATKHDATIRTWNAFVDRVMARDKFCGRLLAGQARALGTAAVNVINILEPDAVVLTGDVLYRGETLRASIERFIAATAINRALRHIPVYLSSLGERPELMAAAGIAAEKFFQGSVQPEQLRSTKPEPVASARKK
jgi:predicted NBD/HSP70 family sugar kinase